MDINVDRVALLGSLSRLQKKLKWIRIDRAAEAPPSQQEHRKEETLAWLLIWPGVWRYVHRKRELELVTDHKLI